MQAERDKILSMLEEGTISAAEADELLASLGESDAAAEPGIHPLIGPAPANPLWQRPFIASLIVFTAGSGLLVRTRRAAGLSGLVRRLVLGPITLLAGLAALLTYLSKDSPWLHVQVQPAEGSLVDIPIPVPLRLARRTIERARGSVAGDQIREQLDLAAELLDSLAAPESDHISVDVAEGSQVKIFLA